MNKKEIFTAFVIVLLFIFFYYLNFIVWVMGLFIALVFYSLLFFVFHIIWSKIRKKLILSFTEFNKIFLYRLSVFTVIITSIIWAFTIYQNEYAPASMPKITLVSSDKIVVFQTMSHIGTANFYKEVAKSIKQAKKDGFVYFFEWVKPWTSQNNQDFNKALWIKFSENLYKNLGKLYWVVNQDNSKFIWLVNDKDYNIDLSIDEIMKLYKNSENTSKNPPKQKIPIDVNERILETLSKLNQRQLNLLVYINKSILNFIIKSDKTKNLVSDNFWNKLLFEIILNKRNEVLATQIINSPHKKIFITYWLLHFDWVFELLKADDKSWKILKKELYYPIK